MKKLLLFLVLIYSVTLSSAQITMINGGSNSVTTATTFYDPGGIANYANNLNVTHTICPGTAGRYVRISFSAFNTELNFDYLYVYNGTTVCTSTLLATLTGTSIPADIISSAPGGCLTFVFVSDATTRRAGFTASLTQQTTIGGTAYVACPTPPTNDNPCAAISLGTINSLCTNTSGTVTLATGSTGVPVPSCGPTLAPFTDVWYYFDATATGTNIQTEALTGTTDMTMQVLTNSSGCAGTWTQLGCDDDNNPSNAMPYLSVSGTTPNPITTVIGQRYYVRVFPYSSGSAGTFNICAYNVQRPNCTSNATPATGSTVGTLRPTLTWNAASLASGYDVYLGTSNPPTTIVSTNQSATSYTPPANLLGDTTYYWYVVPRNIGGVAVSCSSTTTDFNTPTPPANDNCTAAIGLTMNPTNTLTITTSFTTALATQSFIGCTGSADDDVWFYFDATTVRHNIAVSSSLAADLVHEVFNGTCSGSVTSMYCSDADASVGECFVPGQRYLVRVYTHGNASNSGTVTIGVGTSSAASLDATCLTATQICAPFSFTAGVNQPSGGAGCGANYSCLTTTPNPEYHWLQITNTGTLDYTLSSTAGDVDFALWRISGVPVPSSSCGGSQIINCGSSLGTPIACSYSIFATELINVAVTPGYYLLLATNFANAPGVVSLVANVGNTAAVGCPCVISELTATASACNTTNNLYVINGSVTYNSAAPTSGTLTIVDNNGSLVSYNFPFPSSPISYSIVGNTSDGAVHTVQAIFSSNPSCMRCVSYTAPIACCVAPTPTLLNISDAGCGYTFDLQASGGSGPPFEWSTSHTFSPLMSSIVGINFPLGLGTETYYVRTVGQLCSSSIVVTDSSVANNITNGNCMTCYVADGLTRTFYDASNNIIATIRDPLGSTNLATTTACAFVEASNVMFNGQDYMRRHFDIDVTNNGPATVSIYLSPADVSNLISASEDDTAAGYGRFNSMADLCLTAYDGGSESPTSNTSATLIPHGALTISGPVAPNDYYVVSFPVSGFSGFYCHACNPLNTPLPVHYISFDGYHAQSHNMLRWITASEVNNHFFELQRSVDATDWQKIARVDGAGTASTSNSYSFKDNYLEQSYYYYRLKQVDFDGTFHYSNIVYLAGDEISVNNIYPNPSQSIVHYSVASNEEADIVVKIINVAGEVVLEEPSRVYKGANNLLLNVSGIASGAYCLQVINGSTGLRISNTFIKE